MADVEIIDLDPKLSPDGTELLEIQEQAGGAGSSFKTPLSNLIGPEGPAGATGSDGADGAAATVNAGTTTTTAPGTDADVTNSGTVQDAVFDFDIPRGDKGDTGDQGTPGNDGADGSSATADAGTTTTLPAGSNASVSNVGTATDAVFDFAIPKGDKGDQGDVGTGYNLLGTDTVANINGTTAAGYSVGDAWLVSNTGTINVSGSSGTTVIDEPDSLIVWADDLSFVNYGPQQGTEGPQGDAATVAAGATTTGLAGSNANVVNSGTVNDAVFDFTIPRGDKGNVGDQGIKGDQGDAATIAAGTTTTAAPGSNADVSNSGTTSAAIFDFDIPRGATGLTGDAGAKGDTGDAATADAGTTTTTAAGTDAAVTNSGTTSAAVFDFDIPRGDKGDTGDTGAQGDPGTDGVDGKTYYSGAVLPDPAGYAEGDLFMVVT